MKKPANECLFYLINQDTVLYYANLEKGAVAEIFPCVLSFARSISICKCNEKCESEKYMPFIWENLFFTEQEAQAIVNSRNEKLAHFRYLPYISSKSLEEHFEQLIKIETTVNKLLKDCKNYDGIDFCDVYAGGIQVRLHHKRLKNYAYGEQHTIKYDFSNAEDIPRLVAQEFIKNDNPRILNGTLDFIKYGEKYGWD